LTAGTAIEIAGAGGGVVVVTVLPRFMPPTTGWTNVVFIGGAARPSQWDVDGCGIRRSRAETQDTKRGQRGGPENHAQRLDAHTASEGSFPKMGDHDSSLAPTR
jgi:hypothetical protein